MAFNQKSIVLAFDVYGTLLSTESVKEQLASHFGDEKATQTARDWRTYQLEYTWRLNSMKKYLPFSTVTKHSLHNALASADLSLSPEDEENLLTNYTTSLTLFPDVPPLFSQLKSNNKLHPVLFTNASPDQMGPTLSNSSSPLSEHAHLFKDTVLTHTVGKFKPAPEVYELLCKTVQKLDDCERKDVWLISGNPFDVVGANAYGMRTCWVDRTGNGWQDSLLEDVDTGRPTVIVRGVDDVVEKVMGFVRGKE
ncbi:haloacid dehalogenase, type II [Delitschia confertaspora ATCC 74209]|uniref:Haloacid dehalogenase, type II n=1 Tax=Delitschia confertaspora ATCC 74209 TaxID=1513339 RepID=A0A9P4JQZ9_9PLEO|nr:haloacid dehalogenase, type II [Delitschia confertaspora ATCC 74209]